MAIARSVFRRWRPVSPTSRPPLPNHAARPVGAEVDESRGESPTHAAESRPSRKLSIGGANVCTARAAQREDRYRHTPEPPPPGRPKGT